MAGLPLLFVNGLVVGRSSLNPAIVIKLRTYVTSINPMHSNTFRFSILYFNQQFMTNLMETESKAAFEIH